jgi:hypothetical protein
MTPQPYTESDHQRYSDGEDAAAIAEERRARQLDHAPLWSEEDGELAGITRELAREKAEEANREQIRKAFSELNEIKLAKLRAPAAIKASKPAA